MYKTIKPNKTTLRVNKSFEGESIEKKVGRILNNKEKISEPGVQLMYTDRKDGVKAEMNIRTDRWELAVDAMDKVNADNLAKRLARQQPKELKADGEIKAVIGGTETTQTDGKA